MALQPREPMVQLIEIGLQLYLFSLHEVQTISEQAPLFFQLLLGRCLLLTEPRLSIGESRLSFFQQPLR